MTFSEFHQHNILVKKFYFPKFKKKIYIYFETDCVKVGLKLTEGFCSVICPSHLLLFPPPHAIFSNNHISISPLFLWIPISFSFLLLFPQLLGTYCHPLSPLSEYDHFHTPLPWLPFPSCSNIFSSQSGRRVKAMPGKVGINLSPYHPYFLLLLARLIK